MSEEEELQNILKGKKKQKGNEEFALPSSILMAKNAYEKVKKIAEALSKKGGANYEWYSFPLARKGDEEFIVRNVILPQKQDISCAAVNVTGEDVSLAANEVQEINKREGQENYIIGWLHSHASFGTFHSGTDDNNIIKVLNSVSLNTERSVYRNLNLIESEPVIEMAGKNLVMKGREMEDGMLELALEDRNIESLLKKIGLENSKENRDNFRDIIGEVVAGNLELKEPLITGFCYSIVVNNNGAKPFAKMAVIEEKAISHKKNIYQKEMPLEIVSVADDIELNDSEIQALVEKRIQLPYVWSWGNWSLGGKKVKRKFGRQTYNYGNYGGYDYEPYTPQASWQDPNSIPISIVEEKNARKKKADPEEIVEEFTDKVFEHAYSCDKYDHADYLDKILAGTLVTKNLEKAIEDAGEPVTGYGKFVPELLKSLKTDYAGIFLDYAKRNEKFAMFMQEFVESQFSYDRNKIIKELSGVLEDKEVSSILNKKKGGNGKNVS